MALDVPVVPMLRAPAEVLKKPAAATVTGFEDKAFIAGQVSWDAIGFTTAGVYRFQFHASGALENSTFNISSGVAEIEILPCGRPDTLNILEQPGNAIPVKLPTLDL